jgi:hypothetical protein
MPRPNLAGVLFVPEPVQVLRYGAELDQEVPGQVLRFDLAALFPPKTEEDHLVPAHDGPGVRPADEEAAFCDHWSISKVI